MEVWKTKKADALGAVVIVHGLGEHIGRYEWLRTKWLSSGFHVIQGELTGHGSRPELKGHIDSFDEYIEDVRSWTRTAEELGLPVILLGHSLGGLASIRTLEETDLPVDLVILSSPCLGLSKPPPRWLKRFLKPINSFFPKLKVRIKGSADNKWATRNPGILARDAEDEKMLRRISLRWYFETEKAMTEAFRKQSSFKDIPVIIMQAGDDKIVDKKQVKKWYDQLAMERKFYKEWPDYYHEVFNEPGRAEVYETVLQLTLEYLRNKEWQHERTDASIEADDPNL